LNRFATAHRLRPWRRNFEEVNKGARTSIPEHFEVGIPEQETEIQMVRHIVLIDTEQPDQVDSILRAQVPPMVGTVPGLLSVEIGYQDISGLNLTRGYDRVVMFTFGGPGDLEIWDAHPAHAAVRESLSGITSMLVFDYAA
jgi:hypothetical protein